MAGATVPALAYRVLAVPALAWLAVLCNTPVRSNDLFFYLEIGRR